MDFDWELLQRANEEKDRIEKAFKDRFFSKDGSYFKDIETSVEVSATEAIVTTNYNSYKFRRKQNGSFLLKKDKLEQYFYAIDASYTIDTWQKGLEAAQRDFEEIIAIKEDIESWLEDSSKVTLSSSIKRFYASLFGKKEEEQPSIELKEETIQKEEVVTEEKVAENENSPKEEERKPEIKEESAEEKAPENQEEKNKSN